MSDVLPAKPEMGLLAGERWVFIEASGSWEPRPICNASRRDPSTVRSRNRLVDDEPGLAAWSPTIKKIDAGLCVGIAELDQALHRLLFALAEPFETVAKTAMRLAREDYKPFVQLVQARKSAVGAH